MNAIDGMMARELNLTTPLGAVLNEVGDVLSDVALYLPLAFAAPGTLWPVVAFSIAALLTEFCGVLGSALHAGRRYEGPMGKSDRAFLAGALALLTLAIPRALVWWPWLFTAAAVLAILTCWNRIRAIVSHAYQDFAELLARVRSWWAMAFLFFAAVMLSPRLYFWRFGW